MDPDGWLCVLFVALHRPHDIELWLRFVEFQDESSSLHRSTAAAPSLEKKVAILEKAVRLNPRSVPLISAYLAVCQRAHEPARMLKVWDGVMAEHPDSPELWKQ